MRTEKQIFTTFFLKRENLILIFDNRITRKTFGTIHLINKDSNFIHIILSSKFCLYIHIYIYIYLCESVY